LTLLFDSLADRLSRGLVRFGDRLSQSSATGPSVGNSFLLGIGTGFLWAPCAGRILGLILTGAALAGPSTPTTILLLAYAAGAVTSLTIALLAGGRVFAALKRSMGAGEWIRPILGIAVLAGVVAVAFGLDRGILTRVSLASTSSLEQRPVDRFHPRTENKTEDATDDDISTLVPDLSGATAWINSPPLTIASLRGKVVLIDFWTYSCINCLRTLPYVKAWYDKYKGDGLVIIGVHTPEFPFEKDEVNVRKAIRELGISYPSRYG
jgi:thiol-disulfide isomerase/thioredoxin